MTEAAGTLIRRWRQRRHLSQLDLAQRAGVSARHLSFVETGRSRPTSATILRICSELDVPLREQNRVLLAGGFAPHYPEHGLAEPSMAAANAAIEQILAAHLPYPALVIDRGWDLVAANDAVYDLLDGVSGQLLEPPVNVLRLSLHPAGLAPRIVNFAQWREHLLARLQREYDASGDEQLLTLHRELGMGRPGGGDGARRAGRAPAELVVPFRVRVGHAVLSFLTTTTVFGTPREVTLSELAIEAFYPADDATRALLSGRPPPDSG